MVASGRVPIKVALVDDYDVVLRGVANMFEQYRDRIVVAELDANEPAAKTAVLTNAAAINCDGWIVANGFDSVTGANHAYLLKPQDQERRLECVLLRLL